MARVYEVKQQKTRGAGRLRPGAKKNRKRRERYLERDIDIDIDIAIYIYIYMYIHRERYGGPVMQFQG